MFNNCYVRLYYNFFQKQDILAVKIYHFWIVEIARVKHSTGSRFCCCSILVEQDNADSQKIAELEI